MKSPRTKLDTLLLFDGIAIFFIVTAHILGGHSNNPLFFLWDKLGILGLSLFTFSSGYKLMINHVNDLDQRAFLGEYYNKRFIRLYKPYMGYTLLSVFPLVMVVYLAIHVLHLNFPGLSNFFTLIDTMNIFSFLSFFAGNNPIAPQLYYLITLIGITSICFTILYFLNMKWLFFSFSPFFLISMLIQLGIIQDVPVLAVFRYLPFFIFGAYWAYNQQNQKAKWFLFFLSYAPVFFFMCLIPLSIVQNSFSQAVFFGFCCFLFPFVLSSLFGTMKKITFLYSFFIFCGTFAFPIYLFQWPLILPIVTRLLIDILKIDYIFMPLVISIITIYISVFVYRIVKKIHLNVVFE